MGAHTRSMRSTAVLAPAADPDINELATMKPSPSTPRCSDHQPRCEPPRRSGAHRLIRFGPALSTLFLASDPLHMQGPAGAVHADEAPGSSGRPDPTSDSSRNHLITSRTHLHSERTVRTGRRRTHNEPLLLGFIRLVALAETKTSVCQNRTHQEADFIGRDGSRRRRDFMRLSTH